MRQFKRKWTLDRQKFLSEAEVKKLRRAVEDKALAVSDRPQRFLAAFAAVLAIMIFLDRYIWA